MPAWRMRTSQIIAQATILSVVFASVGVLLTSFEFWPITKYDMFSNPVKKSELWIPYGVSRDGHEFSMNRSDYISPFQRGLLSPVLRRIADSDPSQQQLRVAANALFERYSRRRKSDWPEAVRIRVYKVKDYDFASNYDAAQVRELELEVTGP
jgi:hypothetical protein